MGRLREIYREASRQRLDQLLPATHLPWYLRPLLWPMRLRPVPDYSRGERLRRALEALGPIFVKFGQLLSTRPDLLPDDIAKALNALQDRVAPFDSEQAVALIEAALGAGVTEIFTHFERQALASASVAQVHAAELADGSKVVVKVIRPGIERTIARDVQLLKRVAQWLERYSADGRRLRPVEVVEDYEQTIFDELDLMREAANSAQLKRNFEGGRLLYVPKIYFDLCRSNVLVMERIYGIPVTHVDELKAAGTNLKRLAERGVEIFFTQVFRHNFFHADMHPGNIFVDVSKPEWPRYIAIDTAIVGSLSREDQYYLARNMLAMFRRDYRQVAELHVQSGWVPEHTRVEDLEAAVRTVCEPIFAKPLKDISFGQVLIKLFRTARRFDMEVQPQLILLQKTLLNIEGLGRQLYPDLDLWATAHPFLEDWLRQRFHPRTLWQQLLRYGPDWLEKFPELPQRLFDALGTAASMPKLEERRLNEQRQLLTEMRRSRRRRRFGAMLLAAAAGWATGAIWLGAANPPLGAGLLALAGLLVLVAG